MKHIICISILFILLSFSMNSYCQSYDSNYMENLTFGVGIGLTKSSKIDKAGDYRNIALDGGILVKRFLFNMTAGFGWNVGENRYGSGGLSNKHSLSGFSAGYLFPYERFAIAPLIGLCGDDTYYNDNYYEASVGNTDRYFDYGASLFYSYNSTILFSLKATRYFPIGLSVYLALF